MNPEFARVGAPPSRYDRKAGDSTSIPPRRDTLIPSMLTQVNTCRRDGLSMQSPSHRSHGAAATDRSRGPCLAHAGRNGAPVIRLDFRWTDVPTDSEPIAGMSESLAEGLVTRFVEQWRERHEAALARHPPPAMLKRAAYYRKLCEWLRQSVPSELRIQGFAEGDQSGLDKRAWYLVLYWRPDAAGQRLRVEAIRVNGRGDVSGGHLLEITRHALVRLFQRLKTSNPAYVLSEASSAVEAYHHASPLHREVLGLPEILVPTPHGAMLVARNDLDDDGPAVCAKTWISEARMDGRRLGAVRAAREESGFVLMADGQLAVLSGRRLGGRASHQAVYDCIPSQLS